MKKIKLLKLELTNYRNIEHAVYEFNGENCKIVGDNRIGKTNTLEAIHYLLTGYLLNGSSDIQAIKPLTNTRAVVSISGSFAIDDKVITIEKKFGEDWVKQRNTGEEVLKGHFTELWYNGTKQPTTRDFNALFSEDFGVTQNQAVKVSFAQMLSNPFYLGDLCEGDDWKEVRKFIIDLIGDVSDEDVFLKEPLTEILKPELELANGRIDQVKKKVDGEIKGLKEALIADDAKIEMLSKVERPSIDELNGANSALQDINEHIASLRSSSGVNEAEISLKNKIADITVRIAESRALNSNSANAEKVAKLQKTRNDLFNNKSAIQNSISDVNRKIDSASDLVARMQRQKAELLAEYHELKNAKVEVETVCPTCKRPLDPAQIEKAKSEFVANNKTRMEIIVLDGTKLKNQIESKNAEIDGYKTKLAEFEKMLDSANDELAIVNAEIDKAMAENNAPAINPLTEQLTSQKTELEKELADIRANSENARAKISAEIYELEQSKAVHQKVIDDLAYAERQAQEQVKCVAEKENHSKTLVQKEQMKDMIQKFTFTKLQMLDSKVSSVFGNIKFQLVKENINGGFDTVCKPYIYDPIVKTSTNVLWKSGSKSERVATGIAIVEAIKTKLGLSDMPYLFDEGGELSEDTIKTRLQTNSQIICVKVQDSVSSPLVMAL